MMASLPEATNDDKRLKKIVENNCTGCHQPNYTLQHKFDEAGWTAIIDLMKHVNVSGVYQGPDHKAQGMLDHHEKELAAYLAKSRGPGESAMKIDAAPAPVRRNGARRVQGIRRAAAGRAQHAAEGSDDRRQRLVERHAVAPRLAGA